MDRSWILHYQNRFSAEYIAGVNSFIDFAKANSPGAVLINCPCNDCCNHRKQDYVTVRTHLHIHGMMVSYLQWILHGEPIVQPDDSDESDDESEDNQDEYDELIESRAKLPYNHTSGSRSFASRLSLMTAQNASQALPITQFFRDTHYKEISNEWANEVAQQRHEALVQRTEEQSQPSVITPTTEEQIVVDVLGQKSGYLKGYGIYTRTSASSIQSRSSDPEVIALREQLVEHGRRVTEQDRRVAEQDRRQRTLEALVQQLAAATGIDLTSFQDIMGGTSSAGDGTSTRDHDATL